MQQFYKKFLMQTFFFTIQTKIVFSEIIHIHVIKPMFNVSI